MDKNKINLSKIETFFDSLLDGVVSNNTFSTELPVAFNADWDEAVVIDCNSAIVDWDAFGRGTVRIWIYVPPMSSGKKNVKKFGELEQKLNDAIVGSNNPIYRIERRGMFTGYDRERTLFFNVIEVSLTILT